MSGGWTPAGLFYGAAVTAQEAHAAGLVDFLADDVPDLLRQLDGFVVNMDSEERVLRTANLTVRDDPPNLLETLLNILTNPNIVYLLLSAGGALWMLELSAPGGWGAGFLGTVCLALAFYGLGVLPVNWFGIIFIIAAFVLFVIDVQAPTHGALTRRAPARSSWARWCCSIRPARRIIFA